MIKYIKLTNFQAYKDEKVSFSPNLNIIVGESNSGKTSIIRALKTIITGDCPLYYIKYDSKNTRIEAEIDSHIVVRERNKTNNLITIDGEKYERIGSGSTYLQNLFTCNSIKVGGVNKNINIQDQHSSLFFVSYTPLEKKQILDSWVNLDFTDNLKLKLKEDINSSLIAKKEIAYKLDYSKNELEALNNKFNTISAKYEQISSLALKLKEKIAIYVKIENIHNLWAQCIEDINNIENGIKEIITAPTNVIDRVVYLCNFLAMGDKYNTIYNKVKEKEYQYTKIQELAKISAKLQEYSPKLKELYIKEKETTKYRQLYTTISKKYTLGGKKLNCVQVLNKEYTKLQTIVEKLLMWRKAENNYQNTTKKLTDASNTLLETKIELEEFKSSYNICPLCGQSNQNHKAHKN